MCLHSQSVYLSLSPFFVSIRVAGPLFVTARDATAEMNIAQCHCQCWTLAGNCIAANMQEDVRMFFLLSLFVPSCVSLAHSIRNL